jgi:hypothetical protein
MQLHTSLLSIISHGVTSIDTLALGFRLCRGLPWFGLLCNFCNSSFWNMDDILSHGEIADAAGSMGSTVVVQQARLLRSMAYINSVFLGGDVMGIA